jgi:hypothetical protein
MSGSRLSRVRGANIEPRKARKALKLKLGIESKSRSKVPTGVILSIRSFRIVRGSLSLQCPEANLAGDQS